MLESLKVMLLCGSDLLQSFCTPGVWIPEQVKPRQYNQSSMFFIDSTRIYAPLSTLCVLKVRSICKDNGIVCIRREGQDVENMIFGDRILYKTRVSITKFPVSLYQSVK